MDVWTSKHTDLPQLYCNSKTFLLQYLIIWPDIRYMAGYPVICRIYCHCRITVIYINSQISGDLPKIIRPNLFLVEISFFIDKHTVSVRLCKNENVQLNNSGIFVEFIIHTFLLVKKIRKIFEILFKTKCSY